MYVPLRVHGYHSLLTGVDAPEALVERAQGLGLSALALADVDSLAGLVDFLRAAEGEERPRAIVAAEISDPGGEPGRVIALVKTEEGYRNLCKFVSARQLGRDPGEGIEGEYGPEDFDLVDCAVRYQKGLIYLVDHPRLLLDLFGHVSETQLLAAVSPAALSKGTLRDPRVARGESRNTHLAPEARRTASLDEGEESENPLDAPKTPPPARAVPALALVEAARAVGVATIAVPDVYWAFPAGAEDHRVRVAIKHNALLADLPEEWLAEAPAHLPTFTEMCALYRDLPDVPGPWKVAQETDVPGAVQRTLAVAEECRYTPALGEIYFPDVDVPEGETAYSKLCELAFDGARARYRPLRPEVLRRLDYELTTIQQLGFAPYFLLVERIWRFADEAGIPCVGRGSAADSLVAFALGLTDADPLRYGLPFERFLNPTRRDRPDIDLDFCWRRRDEVLDHVFELFGHECTAMISTLNRFGLRSAFREAALVHGIPPAEVNRWSSRLPHFPSHPEELADDAPEQPKREDEQHAPLPAGLERNPLAHTFRVIPEAHDFPFEDERIARVLRVAARLLDTPRHFGLHPGGVVVSPGKITDIVSCQRAAKGPVVTQFDKNAVEAIGLVKMDLLGNRALTVIGDCLASLTKRGITPDIHAILENDSRVAEVLREGRTIGCFQVESPAMRHLLQQTGACTMDDIIQAIALIRPGPAGSGMKDAYVRRFRGLEDPTPPHPRLVDVLWDTHGVMLYQEDVMQVAARVAGMDLAEADRLRRALQKRRTEDIEALRGRFFEGCAGEGIAAQAAQDVWDLVSNFASFAFCKAHAVTYGRISYRAVWLKTHYPGPFLVAFLGSDTGYYPQRVYVEEARRMGVPILPPDVNKSEETFALEWVGETPAMRIGLGQVKGFSRNTLERLLAAREDAPFLSLPDLLERVEPSTDEARHLIQCGTLDGFDRTRPELLWRLHLLRTPQKRSPRDGSLDAAQLAACQLGGTPQDAVRSARAQTGGWAQRGLGLSQAKLAPGESASLFPEPETPGLVLPGLPDTDPVTRGRDEFELLGLTVRSHPMNYFPCLGDGRIRARFGRAPGPTHGRFHSSERERTEADVRPVNPIACADLARFRGGRVTLHGWPAATRRGRTSGGHLMRFLTLEDESGLAEAVLFPEAYAREGQRMSTKEPLCVTGIVQDQMGACTLHVERIW